MKLVIDGSDDPIVARVPYHSHPQSRGEIPNGEIFGPHE